MNKNNIFLNNFIFCSASINKIKLYTGDIEVKEFSYLGNVISTSGGIEEDISARIGKAQTAISLLHNLRKTRQVNLRTKVRSFNSNSVLLKVST